METPNKPDLALFECMSCGNQQWAEKGAQMLCQPCVNQFLARNVGMLEEVTEVVPGPPRAEVPPLAGQFVPGQEGPHGGGTG